MSDKEKTMLEKVSQAIQKAMTVEGNVVYHTFGRYGIGFSYLMVSPSFVEDLFTEGNFKKETRKQIMNYWKNWSPNPGKKSKEAKSE